MASAGDERQAARSRHPAGKWVPDLARMAWVVAARLSAQGHHRPDLAAAVLAERGRLGMDRGAFAAHLGIDEADVAWAEEGAARLGERGDTT